MHEGTIETSYRHDKPVFTDPMFPYLLEYKGFRDNTDSPLRNKAFSAHSDSCPLCGKEGDSQYSVSPPARRANDGRELKIA